MKSISGYLRASRRIEGWFDEDAAIVFDYLNSIQQKESISGNIFEIGVHHGKTSLLLGMFVDRDREKLIVNDLFDIQEQNVSGSGRGSREVFMKNMKDYFGTVGFLKVIRKHSAKLTPKETTTECRIFSIDGGHSREETYSDLRTARRACNDYGLIILDDYFRSGHPGVSEGTCSFLDKHRDIVPWMYFFNKMALVTRKKLKRYNLLLALHGFDSFCSKHNYVIETKRFFGNEMRIFRKASRTQQGLRHVAEKLRQNPRIAGLLNNRTLRRAYSLLHRYPKG